MVSMGIFGYLGGLFLLVFPSLLVALYLCCSKLQRLVSWISSFIPEPESDEEKQEDGEENHEDEHAEQQNQVGKSVRSKKRLSLIPAFDVYNIWDISHSLS